MTKIRSIAAGLAVACGLSLVAGGTYRVAARAQVQDQDPAPAKPAEKPAPTPFERRMKDYAFATIGNMRPLIQDARGVRFQSREAILYRDGSVKVYKLDQPEDHEKAIEPMVPPIRHAGPIREVSIIDDEALLITASDDEVKVWDGLTCELKKAIAGQFMRPVLVGRGFGGGRFATVDVAGKAVTVWDAKTFEPIGVVRPEGSPRLIGAGLSKDNKTLVTLGDDQSVTLRDANDGKPFATLRPPSPPIAGVFGDAPWTDRPILHIDEAFWGRVRFLLPGKE